MELATEKFTADDGMFTWATKKLNSSGGVYLEIGPRNLLDVLDKWIFNGKPHLRLKDVWEYLNRYTYLPRVKDQNVLRQTVQTAIGGMMSGQFAYAESYDEGSKTYEGLAIYQAAQGTVVIDEHSLMVRADIAAEQARRASGDADEQPAASEDQASNPSAEQSGSDINSSSDNLPTQFRGSVKISADRPAKEFGQIMEAVIEQLTTLPAAQVSLRLDIDAEVPGGLDKSKVRTLLENANTLGFDDKEIG